MAYAATLQEARIIGQWIVAVGSDNAAYGTHMMKRSTAALTYRRAGNLRAVELPFGHDKLESTACYLSIEVDDALDISEQAEMQRCGTKQPPSDTAAVRAQSA